MLPFFAQGQAQIGDDLNGEDTLDNAGYSVSMPEPRMIAVGAIDNEGNGQFAGHVRIFSWNGNSWVQRGNDIDADSWGDRAGYAVSMPDTLTVAIGAPGDDGNGAHAGHVRVFRWNGSAWVQKGSDIDGEAGLDRSGSAVSMPDSNTVAIGAPHNNNPNGDSAGHVRVYRWDGAAWVQKGGDIDGDAAKDSAGYSVSMPDSNTVSIGAPQNDGNGTDAGQVRVYDWNGTAWAQRGGDIDGESSRDHSGWSAHMPDTNTVAIGAWGNDGVNGTNSGHTRIYRWDGSAWVQKGGDIDGEAAYDHSGCEVRMSDSNSVAIGAFWNDGGCNACGHVRAYEWQGGAWVQNGSDIDADGPNHTGKALSMPDPRTVGIGGPLNPDNGPQAGHARVFDLCNSSDSMSSEACFSYVTPVDGDTVTSSGIYEDTLSNQAECDSIVIMDVSIDSVNTAVIDSAPSLTAEASGASYQWLDCDSTMSPIAGATDQSYTASSNGIYAVEVTQNGCTDTSACFPIENTSVDKKAFGEKLSIRPNPTDASLKIGPLNRPNKLRVRVRDVHGRTVKEHSFENPERIELELQAKRAGLYFLDLRKSSGERVVFKVIKE